MQITLEILNLLVLALVFVAMLPISIVCALIVRNLPDDLKGVIEADVKVNVKPDEKE